MKKVIAGCLAVLLLGGCQASEPTKQPASQKASVPAAPAEGETLDLEYAPKGLSVPRGAIIVEQIDQVNNITLVFSAPTGAELAAYYRRALPTMGFTITADGNNSLTFADEQWHGAFTAAGAQSALTLRTDWE